MTTPIDPLNMVRYEIDRNIIAPLNTVRYEIVRQMEALRNKVVEDTKKAVQDITDPAAVKGETSIVKGEAVGASVGLKLFSAEKSLFDLQEWLDEKSGKGPKAIKKAAEDAMAEAKRANRRLDTVRSQLRGNTPQQHANFHNTGTFSETAAQINRLEGRVNSLVQALE